MRACVWLGLCDWSVGAGSRHGGREARVGVRSVRHQRRRRHRSRRDDQHRDGNLRHDRQVRRAVGRRVRHHRARRQRLSGWHARPASTAAPFTITAAHSALSFVRENQYNCLCGTFYVLTTLTQPSIPSVSVNE